MLILIAIAVFIAGGAADIWSSIGQREANRVFRKKDGRFDARKNAIWKLVVLIALVVIHLWLGGAYASVMLLAGGVLYAVVAYRNMKVTRRW